MKTLSTKIDKTPRKGTAFAIAKALCLTGKRQHTVRVYPFLQNKTISDRTEETVALLTEWGVDHLVGNDAPVYQGVALGTYVALTVKGKRQVKIFQFEQGEAVARPTWQAVKPPVSEQAIEEFRAGIRAAVAAEKPHFEDAIARLHAAKDAGHKSQWHDIANAIVQKVSNNNYQHLPWKDILNEVRNTVALWP